MGQKLHTFMSSPCKTSASTIVSIETMISLVMTLHHLRPPMWICRQMYVEDEVLVNRATGFSRWFGIGYLDCRVVEENEYD